MSFTRRQAIRLSVACSALGANDDRLQTELRESAAMLGLPGFVAGVVREGKLSMLQSEGFADIESRTPMRADHIFYLASLTKTFCAVTLMQYAQEKKISLDDYVLDYPFLSVGFTADRLADPNLRLKHVLSHTSEGKPGDQYIYNGNRFNFLYGVFEKVSGNTRHHEAFAEEVRKRILQPLGMDSTMPGYPSNNQDERISRITTPYLLDSRHKTPTRDKGPSGLKALYPSSNLLSTVGDLAKYAMALDENALLAGESYARMTAPYQLNDGRKSSYGLGWSTQQIGGESFHWHYGYGDSYASLLIRVPARKISFIFLSNTGAASAPFLLGYGNLLTSPFAVAFVQEVVARGITDSDRRLARLLLVHYAEQSWGRSPGEAKRLLRELETSSPGRWENGDWVLITLVSALGDASHARAMERMSKVYASSGAFHPEIHLAIANYFERIGRSAEGEAWLKAIADKEGYGEASAMRVACKRIGTSLIQKGKVEEGRRYLWKHALHAASRGEKVEAMERMIRELRP